MKKPIPKIRVFSQRTIAPSFFNRTPVEDSSENPSKKRASFSEFLDSKVNKSLLFKPNNIKERSGGPFTSLVSSNDLTNGFGTEEKKVSDGGIEMAMLQQFKPRENERKEEMSKDVVSGDASVEALDQATAEEVELLTSLGNENDEEIEVLTLWGNGTDEDIIVKDEKLSKKRKDPFEGMENVKRTGKPVIVFGGDSKVSKPMMRKREGERSDSSKRQKPYNHYANGSGWWDGDMEGVDSEEVGHSEVWEGVGSTTYGDIVDWH